MIVLFGIGAVFALVLLTPFNIDVDTRSGRLGVGWIFFMIGIDRRSETLWVGCCGATVRWRRGKTPKGDRHTSGSEPEPSSKVLRLLERLASDPRRAARLTFRAIRLLRCLRIARVEGELSFEDPMVSGVWYGIVEGIDAPRIRLAVNFEDRNWLSARLRFLPIQAILPALRLLAVFPWSAFLPLRKEAGWAGRPGLDAGRG